MPMISYAQNYEDVLLRRLFPDASDGFYIDVGASDPVYHSVTKHFSDRGWHGINVEPIPEMHRRLREGRPRDVNLNLAVSDREGVLTFFEAPGVFSWSVSRELIVDAFGARPEEVVPREVPVATLASICERHAVGSIDFLKVDAEDHETEVLRGADWARWRPRAVVVEGAHRPWEPILLSSDYRHAAFDGINHYYIRGEDVELLPRLAAPVNVTDDFVQYEQWERSERLERQLARANEEIEGLLGLLYESRQECERSLADRDQERREAEELRLRLARFEDLGPTAVGVARRLRGLARRHRVLAGLVRPALRGASAPEAGGCLGPTQRRK